MYGRYTVTASCSGSTEPAPILDRTDVLPLLRVLLSLGECEARGKACFERDGKIKDTSVVIPSL